MQLNGNFEITYTAINTIHSETVKSRVMFTAEDPFNEVMRRLWFTALNAAIMYCQENDYELLKIEYAEV
jgi:hypothetical protein